MLATRISIRLGQRHEPDIDGQHGRAGVQRPGGSDDHLRGGDDDALGRHLAGARRGNGVDYPGRRDADGDGDGGVFSSDFTTSALAVSGSPYPIDYEYAGDPNLDPAGDATQTLTVNTGAPAFSGLAAPTITYGAATTTLSGDISPVPDGETVSITLDGVTQSATVTGGAFSSDFTTSALAVSDSPYPIDYEYAGDANLDPAGDATQTLTVNAAALTITASAQSKTYGSALTLGTTAFTTSGLLNSDTVTGVTLSSGGAAATATVAFSPYTITPSAATGSGLGNYTITYDTGNLTVNAAALTITASARSKTYGSALTLGTTAFTTSGLLNSETVTGVTLSSGGAAATATVALSPYTITPSAATGSGLGNYTITYDTGNLTVNAAALTITAATNTKTYDTTTSTAAKPTVTGLQGSDTVTGLVEAYADANAGTAKTVSVTGYTVNDGNSGKNYTVTLVPDTKSVINAAALTITAATNTKTYDATTSASATPTVAGLKGTNTVTGLVEAYDDANAGTAKTVSVTGYTVNDGNSGKNYTVTLVPDTKSVINAAALTITAATNTKAYDATTSASATPTVAGLKGTNTVTGLVEAYDDANAGTAKTVSVTGYTVNDGNSGKNYTVTLVPDTKSVINAAALTIMADMKLKGVGAPLPTFTFSCTGLIGNDSLTTPPTMATSATATSPEGIYTITVSGGTASSNYAITRVDGDLDRRRR